MKTFSCACAVVILLTGCAGRNPLSHSADLPITYYNAEYGFTFSLPAEWRGYSVLMEQWEVQSYVEALDKTVVAARGAVMVLRHPQWTPAEPHQDIPIMVFTRKQWDAEHEGKFSIGAGGVDEEIGHNAKYVFAISSRFNWGEAKGWEEAGRVVERNRAANGPFLHPE